MDGQILRLAKSDSLIEVVCGNLPLFVGMFVGSNGQPLDAIPEVDTGKQGVSATQLAALDALANRYVE